MQLQTVICEQPSDEGGLGFKRPLPNAKVTVTLSSDGTPAQIYNKDEDPISNPMTADINGNAQIRLEDGVYDIQVASADLSYNAPLLEQVQFFDEESFSGISGLAGLSATGLVARTGESGGVSTFETRTVTGAPGKITVTNGDGVAGNPTLTIAAGAVTDTEMASGAAAANLGYTAETTANKDTTATLGTSDTHYPSQKAVKTYVDGLALGGDLSGAPSTAVIAKVKGVALSADTLVQGQGYVYDAPSTSLKAKTSESVNYLVNPAFDIWQENTTYSPASSSTKVHAADFWKIGTQNLTGRTFSRVTGIAASQYAAKSQRTAGNANLGRIILGQQLGTADAMFLAGKTVTMSCDFVKGADYSPTQLFAIVYYGTGTDEDIAINSNAPAFATGGGNVASSNAQSQVAAAGTSARIVFSAIAIPAGVTELFVSCGPGNFVGTAGADDSCTIGNIKLEVSSVATHFRKPLAGDELHRCQRRYFKTFLQATVPAQNIGTGTGERIGMAGKAGATAETFGTIQFPHPMRTTPTGTLYNPAAANAQVRDLTAALDCSSSAIQNISDCGAEIICTGNASTAVGNRLGVHATFDARL